MTRVLILLAFFLLFLSACVAVHERVRSGPVHLVAAITGLGSSVPGIGDIWTKWAKDMLGRVADLERRDVELLLVSADGSLEQPLYERVEELLKARRLRSLTVLTHSNGFRDGLFFATWLADTHPGVSVDYFAGIDMTLGPMGATVPCNIKVFDEFHAALRRADFAEGCEPSDMIYTYRKIARGHTAAASDPAVQDAMLARIRETLDAADRAN